MLPKLAIGVRSMLRGPFCVCGTTQTRCAVNLFIHLAISSHVFHF